ncbi:tetratricopeptide repeat protein [Actinomadura sp. NBRC 104412]|uniref:tetratricopeptide repeat protein n=1 Tax=Actinomadura sp. NBRC 104412 TaxID=3032203 RepID=UPI002555417C|nr:tetratricopeptide repeat protein [Actinomadura sp. NBRC 104412]
MHRTILCADVEEFCRPDRTNPVQVAVRAALRKALETAFGRSALRWERCHREDRGDGVLILVPPEIPKGLLAGPFMSALSAALAEHNRQAPPSARIRLRVALNAGEVQFDAHGVAGTSINQTFRLLESKPLKEALRTSQADLALIVSQWFYGEVVHHQEAGEFGAFDKVPVRVKETMAWGWLRLPDEPRTVLGSSCPALAPPAARMFRLLALHPGPDISVPAATALSGATTAQTRRLLDTLARAHLLVETPAGRYRLTGPPREYATELAVTEGGEDDADSAVRRALSWYLHTADDARDALSTQRRTISLSLHGRQAQAHPFASMWDAHQWCEAERVNLMAAARHAAATGNHDIGWRLPLALWELFSLRGPWVDWVDMLRTALDSARDAAEEEGEARALTALGYACQDRWLFHESADHLLRARPLFRRIGDRMGEAWALHGLGLAVRRLQRYEEATLLHRETLHIATEVGDRGAQAWALGGLGFSYAGGRRYAESLEQFQRSLRLARQADRRAEGWAGYGLGHAYQRLRRPDRAVAHYRPALEIFRAIGDWPGEAETLDALARIQLWAGEREAARASWTSALRIFRLLRMPQEARVRDRLLTMAGQDVVDYPEVEAAIAGP